MKKILAIFGIMLSLNSFANSALHCQVKKITIQHSVQDVYLLLNLNCQENINVFKDPHMANTYAPMALHEIFKNLVETQEFSSMVVTNPYIGRLLQLNQTSVGSATPRQDFISLRQRNNAVHSVPNRTDSDLYQLVMSLLESGEKSKNSLEYKSEDGLVEVGVYYINAHISYRNLVGPRVLAKTNFQAKNPEDNFIVLNKKESERFLEVFKLESDHNVFSETNDQNDHQAEIQVDVNEGLVKMISVRH